MLNATHYVLDLETLGKGPQAAIVAIGCVRVENGQLAGEFYERIDLQSAMAQGGQVDGSTIQWWLSQSEEARVEVNGMQDSLPIHIALELLASFMRKGEFEEPRVWGNGSTFDNVITTTALERCGIQRPWEYWNDRDLRTLVELYPAAKQGLEFEGVKHHALHDARHEAKILCAAQAIRIADENHKAESLQVIRNLLDVYDRSPLAGKGPGEIDAILAARRLMGIDLSLDVAGEVSE